MLGHLRDLDADFLAIYGIDLEREPIDGPRFFSLAHRLPAYQGVLAARVEAERDDRQEDAPAGQRQVQQGQTAAGSEVREVSLTALRVQFPGLVSMGTNG